MAGELIRQPSMAAIPLRANQLRNISGDDSWFGPLQPLPPMAPQGTKPRQLDYEPGANLVFTPRKGESVGFGELIYMADNCDLVRIVIEALKDQLALLPWQIRLKQEPNETDKQRKAREKGNDKIKQWTEFFSWPNPDQCWDDFLRMLLEDLFVLDAPAILLQRKVKGSVGALRPIDGQTISRVIDEQGFTPLAPNPAYQQILYGMPAIDLTTDDLVYRPRNMRARKFYGYSPVEQILMTLNIAVRRQRFQLANYTDGNIPEALYTMPQSVNEDQVRKFQNWFDQELQGNLQARRRIWFIPGDDKGVNRLHWTKENLIKDEADEWFARIICYAFRISANAFIRIMARATAEESQETSEEIGVRSNAQWITNTMNYILQRKSGEMSLEFAFSAKREADPLKQAQTDQIHVDMGVKTRNEVREKNGDDPSPDPMANELTITTAMGATPLAQVVQQNEMAQSQQETGNKQADRQFDHTVKQSDRAHALSEAALKQKSSDDKKKASNSKADSDLPLTKNRTYGKGIRIETHDEALHPSEVATLEKIVASFLRTVGDDLADRIAAKSGVQKSDKPWDKQMVFDLIDETDWSELAVPAETSLYNAASTGSSIGIGQIGVSNIKLISSVSEAAQAYAHRRAAELVGKQWRDGKLIDNPNAKYHIDRTTRDELRALVEKAFGEETRMEDLVTSIRDAGAFGEPRAKTIARTEVAMAQSFGTYDVWKTIGTVKTVQWDMSADHDESDECDHNSEAGPIEFGKAFPSGDLRPPAHPNCRCALVAVDIE